MTMTAARSTFPKYAIGKSHPDDTHTWIIRLRNPLLLARVEQRGAFGMHLHCWPREVEKRIGSHKLARVIGDMAAIWSTEVEHSKWLPNGWSFCFTESFTPPDRLVMTGARSEWIGILETLPRRLYQVRSVPGGGDMIEGLLDFGEIGRAHV